MNDSSLLPEELLTLQLATQGLFLGRMNPPKCEQYFYLFYQERKSLDHLKEIKEAEKNTIIPPFLLLQRQGGHAQAGCWSQHPPGGVTAHALRSAGSTANAPLPNNHSLLIFDRQPKCFCEESK